MKKFLIDLMLIVLGIVIGIVIFVFLSFNQSDFDCQMCCAEKTVLLYLGTKF